MAWFACDLCLRTKHTWSGAHWQKGYKLGAWQAQRGSLEAGLVLTSVAILCELHRKANLICSRMLDSLFGFGKYILHRWRLLSTQYSASVRSYALRNLSDVLIILAFVLFSSQTTLTELCLCKATLRQLLLAAGIQIGREDG